MALDSYLRYQYLDERVRAREQAREKANLDRALAQLARRTTTAKATAEDISGTSQRVTDIDTLNQYLEDIESMKVGVDYVDTFLDAHKDKIELRKHTVNTYNAIDDNIKSLLDNAVTSGEPTDGFMSILRDNKKNLTDIASGLTQPALKRVNDNIQRAEGALEFVNRIGAYDTDPTTPKIDWEQTGEREVVDAQGVKSMQPIYAHDAHTRGYIESIVKPEADVNRKMKDFTISNKLLALAPGNIRAERLQLNVRAAKEGQENLEKLREDVITHQYSKPMGSLGKSKGSRESLFKPGRSDISSLLSRTSAQLDSWGGMSKDAQRNLPVSDVVKRIESNIFMLAGIVSKKIITPYMANPKSGKSLIKYPDTYDPINPSNRGVIDKWITDNLYDEKTGFKRSSKFFTKTKKKHDAGFKTAMKGYIDARRSLLEGVDMRIEGSQGWFYPEFPAAGDATEDDIINPYDLEG